MSETNNNNSRNRMVFTFVAMFALPIVVGLGSILFQNETGITCIKETVTIVVKDNGDKVAHVSSNIVSCLFESAILPGLVTEVAVFLYSNTVFDRLGWWPIREIPWV